MEIELYIIVICQNLLIHLYLYEFSQIQKIILFPLYFIIENSFVALILLSFI